MAGTPTIADSVEKYCKPTGWTADRIFGYPAHVAYCNTAKYSQPMSMNDIATDAFSVADAQNLNHTLTKTYPDALGTDDRIKPDYVFPSQTSFNVPNEG